MDQNIRGFLLSRESDGRSVRTLEWHEGALRLFYQWLNESQHSVDPADWTPTLLRTYFVHLKDRQSSRSKTLSQNTVRNYASSVLAYCRWLYEEELLTRNIVERVSTPKTTHLVKEPFQVSEIKSLLSAAKNDRRNGLRDYALLLFMLDTGCRASEVVGLKTNDVIWSQRLAKVLGKGNKERVVFISPETARAMLKYQSRVKDGCDTFFQTEEGKTMSAHGLLQITKRIAKTANVLNVHPHRFRHTFAISFLRSGGNLIALQRILGHTTLSMTTRYLAMVSDDLAREHSAFSPVQSLLSR